MGLIVFGDNAFRDRGLVGVGIQGYAGAQGYTPYDLPTKVGARHFFPEPEYDADDKQVPAAMGNKWDGGKKAYQMRVWEAAKAFGKTQGLKRKEIDNYKPRVVA